MGTATDVVAAVRGDLERLAVPTTSGVRAVRRRYSTQLRPTPARLVFAVADALLRGTSWPERLVGCELLTGRIDALHCATTKHVDRWANGLADWGSIDMYGVTVAGVAWREGVLSDRQVMQWTRSPDRWRRRLALVATVPLNSRARGGSGDAARTLRVCHALVGDRGDMVIKAMSWALRELSKRDPDAVRQFIGEYEDRLASRVRREVSTKIETGRKR